MAMKARMRFAGALLASLSGMLSAQAADTPLVRPLPAAARADADAAIDRGLGFLKAVQGADGGWRAAEGSDPAITALVVKCFAQSPQYGPDDPLVRRAYAFILKAQQPDGGIYLPEQGMHNYYTSVAIMALHLSQDEPVQAAVRKAEKYLTDLQWDEGEQKPQSDVFYGGAGYGHGKRPDLSNTQMMLEALHESGLSPEHPVYRKALVFISRCQMLPATNDQAFAAGGDGGFIYSPANGGESKAGTVERGGRPVLRTYGSMTYSGFKSLLYAGVKHDDPRVQAAWDWIRSHYTLAQNPNMPEKQSKEGLFYFFHVFAKALDAWGENVVTDAQGTEHPWREELIARLKGLQRPDGSWVNEEDRWWESNPQLVTAYSVLALQAASK